MKKIIHSVSSCVSPNKDNDDSYEIADPNASSSVQPKSVESSETRKEDNENVPSKESASADNDCEKVVVVASTSAAADEADINPTTSKIESSNIQSENPTLQSNDCEESVDVGIANISTGAIPKVRVTSGKSKAKKTKIQSPEQSNYPSVSADCRGGESATSPTVAVKSGKSSSKSSVSPAQLVRSFFGGARAKSGDSSQAPSLQPSVLLPEDCLESRIGPPVTLPLLRFLILPEKNLSFEDECLKISQYFDYKRCYDVMPVSGKVVVLEVHLQVEKAFHSLVAHLIRAAPLWDSTKMAFVGMLTITDFIDILLYFDSNEEQIKDLESHKICEWRSITGKHDYFIHIQPEVSLTEAIKLLVREKVHRLPIYCPKQHAVLFVLTHKRILKYFYLFGLGKSGAQADIHPLPKCFNLSIRELEIGTYTDIATATPNMTVIDALKIFQRRKVSALPVIEEKTLVNIYAKFDVLALARGKSYSNLTLTIKEALSERGEISEGVATCTQEDTLEFVLDKIIECEVHRLVVVDDNKAVVGMLSLSDILKFLVLKPLGLLNASVSSLAKTEIMPKETASAESVESFPDELESGNSVLQQTVYGEESTNYTVSSDSSPKFEAVCDSDAELVTCFPTLLPEENLDSLENITDKL